LVHNFLPHGRGHGVGGFRYWVTRERKTRIEKRCHCGWLDGRKHYGTLEVMNQKGKVQS